MNKTKSDFEHPENYFRLHDEIIGRILENQTKKCLLVKSSRDPNLFFLSIRVTMGADARSQVASQTSNKALGLGEMIHTAMKYQTA
jgi:hypothetical protein